MSLQSDEVADRGNAHKTTKEFSSYDADARTALDYLKAHPACTGDLGVFGMCLGGHLAFRAAMNPDVKAACVSTPPTSTSAAVSQVLGDADQQELLNLLGTVSGAGRRGLLASPAVAALARSERLLDLVRPHLAYEPFPVRVIYFDKSPDANWLVPWHQDLTLALRSQVEVPGFGPWSVKDGVPHVQPPVELLEQMLTVRLHLDDADEANGALRVLPGSHRLGRLPPTQIQALRVQQTDVLCAVAAGDALLMRPLLLHASGRSTSQERHRRVLHIEYAAFALPDGLHWHEGG